MKKNRYEPRTPFQDQPHIQKIDLQLDGVPVKVGTLLKIKHDKTAWTYHGMYHNKNTDTVWVDLKSAYGWKSVRPEQILGEFVQKRSRRKKKDNS